MISFNELPDELILMIFSYLSYNEVLKVAGVSRRCHAIAHDWTIWKNLRIGEQGWIEISKFKEIITAHPEISYINFRKIFNSNYLMKNSITHSTKSEPIPDYDKEMMKMVRTLRNLKTLIYYINPGNSPGIIRVLRNNNITTLAISNITNRMPISKFKTLKEIGYICPNLVRLEMDGYTGDFYNSLNKLKKLEYLRILDIKGNEPVILNMESLLKLIISGRINSDIRFELNLLNLRVFAWSQIHCCEIFNLPNIRHISTNSFNLFCDASRVVPFNIRTTPHVEFLTITNTRFNEQNADHYSQFNITEIRLEDIRSPVVNLDKFINLTKLVALRVKEIDIIALNNINLTNLTLINCDITDDMLKNLTRHIEYICLDHNKLTGAVMPDTSRLCLTGNPLEESNLVGLSFHSLTIRDWKPNTAFRDNEICRLILSRSMLCDKTINMLYKNNKIELYDENRKLIKEKSLSEIVDTWVV